MKLFPLRGYIFIIIAHINCYCEVDQNTTAIDSELTAQIDNFITNHYVPNAGITGLGISVVRINGSDQALYSNGYGMADQEKRIPNGNQTQFLIASITKSITSVVVVKILNEKFPEMGEAVLDTPIMKLIPSANFTLNDRFRSEHGTFRDLLAHRTCIGRHDMLLLAEPFNTTSEMLYRQRYAEESCSFRSEFLYNNEMFPMAGELIGILANQSFETLLEDLLIQIGMLHSTVSKKSDDYSRLPFRARPHYVKDNVSHPINTRLLKRGVNTIAAGGVWSTPDDMAKYMSFHLLLGKVGDKQVIPESVMKWLSVPSNRLDNSYKSSEEDIVINPISYGLGLQRASYDGWELLGHGGYFNAFSSILSLFPSQKIGIFTTSNQSPASVSQDVLHVYIFEIFRGSPNALEISSKILEHGRIDLAEYKINRDKIIEQFFGQVEVDTCQEGGESNLSNITGHYGSGSLGDIEIFEKLNLQTNSTGLYLSYGKWAHGWLESYGSSINDSDTNSTDVVNLKIIWDTDIMQENYAYGDNEGPNYAKVYNDTFEFLWAGDDEMISYGKFRVGVSLQNLPAIPWNQDSC